MIFARAMHVVGLVVVKVHIIIRYDLCLPMKIEIFASKEDLTITVILAIMYIHRIGTKYHRTVCPDISRE